MVLALVGDSTMTSFSPLRAALLFALLVAFFPLDFDPLDDRLAVTAGFGKSSWAEVRPCL